MKTPVFGFAHLGRLITVVITCLSLLSQAAYASVLHPSAQSFNLQTWNQTAEALRPRFSVTVRPSAAKIDQKKVDSKKNSTHVGQAGRVLLLVTALYGVELVRRQAREVQVSGRTLSMEEYSKLAAQTALQVADSGDIWMGIASDIGIGIVAQKPAAALNEVLKNKVAKPLFVNLIQTSIMSLIYFVGFQACAQLWRDARLMLDPKDYDKSERIWSMGFKGFANTVNSKSNSDEARITRQMFGNMAKILFLDDELRENWFYNTWRLSIATGRFVTLVSGIISATVIGTAIFPGAGTVLGFMFALTGAVAAAALPASFTEKVTIKLKNTRLTVSKLQARQQNWRLKNLINAYSNKSFFWKLQSSSSAITQTFNRLKRLRERVTTVYIEELYLANTNIQKYTHELALATANRKAKEYVQVKNLLITQQNFKKQLLQQMVQFYKLQFRNLEKIEITELTPNSVVSQIDREKIEIATVHSFLSTFAVALFHSSAYPSSELVLQNYYLRSFRETGISGLANRQTVKRL